MKKLLTSFLILLLSATAKAAYNPKSLTDADIPNTITISLAATATALAANGSNCSAGNYPLGVDASGAVETCTADDDTPDSDAEVPNDLTIATSSQLSVTKDPTDATSANASLLINPATSALNEKFLVVQDNGSDVLSIDKEGDVVITGTLTGAFSGAISGNASTATALAANPSDCSANQFATTIAANGNLTCAALVDADVPDALTISGGTVNNTVIGGSTPTAGTFTTLGTTATNAAGGSANPLDITATLGIMDGSDEFSGLELNLTNAIHTGASNSVFGVKINDLNFYNSETATGIKIGSGWKTDLEATGTIKAAQIQASSNFTIPGGAFFVDDTGEMDALSVKIGSSGTLIRGHLSGTATNLTSASISAASCGTYGTITVTGALVGNTVYAAPDADSSATGIEDSNLIWNAVVTSANTVTIRACNPTAGAIDAGNDQEWRADVWVH